MVVLRSRRLGDRLSSRLSSDGLRLGRFREVGLLETRLRRNRLSLDRGACHRSLGHLGRGRAANVSLSLGAVVARVLLHQSRRVGSVLLSNAPDMARLRVDQLLHSMDLLIDGFAVADVDKRPQIGDGHGNQSQTPHWQDLAEPVGDESGREGLSSALAGTL